MNGKWKVNLSREAKKQYLSLKYNGLKKVNLLDVIDTLVIDLTHNGPVMRHWPNYDFIDKGKNSSFYHCHLKKGRPTFVACWLAKEEEKIIEVFYVGTHENAPY